MRFSEALWEVVENGGFVNKLMVVAIMFNISNVVSFKLAISCKIQAKPRKHSPWSKLNEQRAK